MRIAYWIPKATNTLSEYIILIAFLLQQWLHERASLLRYGYIAFFLCLNLPLSLTGLQSMFLANICFHFLLFPCLQYFSST